MTNNRLHASDSAISLWRTPNLDEAAQDAQAAEPEQSPEEIRAEAYAAGFEQGRQEAFDSHGDELRDKLDRAEALLATLESPLREIDAQVGEELGQLAVKIAKALVRRELRTEPETIMALVRDTVAALNTTANKVQIHLNPEDARLLEDIAHLDQREQCWQALEDPLIPRGDCKVSCGDSLIDGNLQARLNQIVIQFLGDERGEARS